MAEAPFNDALGASYRLKSKIGQGATGDVWLAVDVRTGESVAAKLLRPEHVADRELVGRFMTERSVLLDLHDPGIVAVRDLVAEGNRLAIVMDYVDGGSARALTWAEQTILPREAVALTASVLGALAVAHGQGVLHRDVKPDNVLLTADWRTFTRGSVRLTDFGIARLVGQGSRSTTGVLGTPEYMSPELITLGECSFPADVYAAGIMLYELLAGRTPFAGPGTDFTVANRQVTARPPTLPVPAALWSVIERMLQKDPGARPTAAEAAAALRRIEPSLEGLPGLPTAEVPAEFERIAPVTQVRGRAAEVDEGVEGVPGDVEAVEPSPMPDLGSAPHQTIVRPVARPIPVAQATGSPGAGVPADVDGGAGPLWRHRKLLLVLIGALVVAIGVAMLVVRLGPSGAPAPSAAAAVKATQQDRPTPTGLTISRTAEFDPQSQRVRLTITYAAQNAPLSGPFLEVLPGLGAAAECPAAQWSGAVQKHNLPSTTGITTACAWSVDVDQVPKQGSQSVTVDLTIPGIAQNTQALQQWLDGAADATASALADSELSGAAYPVQRLQTIQVVAPARIATGKSLQLVLLPVWPSGPDKVNILYRSPSVDAPSSMLVAIAGGTSGVRFSDGCSGSLKASSDGLSMTTLTMSSSCTVNAKVGNFADLSSNSFEIVSRGG